jgi:hypothetical protein
MTTNNEQQLALELLEAVDTTLREHDARIDDVLNVTLHIAVLAAKEVVSKDAFLKIAANVWDFNDPPSEVH